LRDKEQFAREEKNGINKEKKKEKKDTSGEEQ